MGMLWLKKLNFIETAKLEMELMNSFEAGQDLEAKIELQRELVKKTKNEEQAWKLEVWQKMLGRIRKMEKMMGNSDQPNSQ